MVILPRLVKDSTRFMNIKRGVPRGLCFTPPPSVEKPTYEIVGETERPDGRDAIVFRFLLEPGTPEYEDYYQRNPERKAGDERLREISARVTQKLAFEDSVNSHIASAGFSALYTLASDEAVETMKSHTMLPRGKIPIKRLELDADEMSLKIKAFALQLGVTKVGITRLNPDWVWSHYGVPRYGKPVELNYKYLICLALWQDPALIGNGLGPSVFLDVGWRYSHAALMSIILANFIRHLGWPALPLPALRDPYLVIPHFINAGVGEIARCGLLVTKEFGNNWRPAAVATDLPLTIDKPVDFGLQDFCEKCTICADSCPSGAIPKGDRIVHKGVRKWKIDAEKCFSFWQSNGNPCSVCQAVCPWSHPNNLLHNSMRELGQRFKFLRSSLIKADRAVYRRVRPPKQGVIPKWMTMPPH